MLFELRVRVTYHADQWPAAPDGGRGWFRGVYRSQLDGFPMCEGTGGTVRASVERLAVDLLARIDVDESGSPRGAERHNLAEKKLLDLAQQGRLVEELLAVADEATLEGDISDL